MTTTSDWPAANTQHGLLVAFGEFLKQHGLIESLMRVPIAQKTRRFPPQAKLVEFLVGTQSVSGMEHLEDLTEAPHPLTKDPMVIQAWGQSGFAHYSSVSRTLEVCDAQTVRAVEQAISDFNRPFINTQVNELLRRGMAIQYDLDLKTQRLGCHGHSTPISRIGRKERLRSNCCGQNRVWEERRAGRTAGVLAAGIDVPDPDRPEMGQHFRSLSQCFAPEGVWSTTTRNDFGAHRTRSWVQLIFVPS